MNWLSELIVTAEERNWCTWSACQVCGRNVGFRLFVGALRREEVLENLRALSQEICDRHASTLRTVFVDTSRLQGIKAGTDLVGPLKGTPAGAVLESAIRHAQERYVIWCAKERYSSPKAARARAEERKQRIAEDQKLRSRRRAELDEKLSIFREAIGKSDFDRFFSELRGVEDPLVVRAIGGIAYSVLREGLSVGEVTEAHLKLLQRCALSNGGHWAKLLKINPSVDSRERSLLGR